MIILVLAFWSAPLSWSAGNLEKVTLLTAPQKALEACIDLYQFSIRILQRLIFLYCVGSILCFFPATRACESFFCLWREFSSA